MKGLISKLVFVGLFATSASFAASTTTSNGTTTHTKPAHNMWICTTNASSAESGSAGEKADKYMADHASAGASAFAYALKNCRDCTKITCSVHTN